MAIHFTKTVIHVAKTSTKVLQGEYEKIALYTATEDNNPATAHGYPSRALAQNALRTYVHAHRV